MAFIPTPNCVQGRLQYQNTTGVLAENVFYFATTSVPVDTDLSEIGAAIATWVLDDLKGIVVPLWTVVGIVLRALNEAEGLESNYITGFPITGSAAGDAAPNNVSYTVTWSTGLVGRSARGRTYGLGIANSDVLTGTRLSDAAQTLFQAKWDNLRLSMNDAAHGLQVVSFQEGGVPRTAGRALPVLSANVRFPLATQRRRLT